MAIPSSVTFPLRQRLTLQGVFADKTLPAPMAAHLDDYEGTWTLQIDALTEDDSSVPPAFSDGHWSENAPLFETEPLNPMLMTLMMTNILLRVVVQTHHLFRL